MNRRDASVELYRILLMFGICFLHANTFSGHVVPWLANLFAPCVDGFVFLSGFYGIRFRLSKVMRLWGVALFCAVASASFIEFFQGGGLLSLLSLIQVQFTKNWFLNEYTALMLIAPALNYLMDHIQSKDVVRIGLPFVLLFFCWNWAGDYLSRTGCVLPRPQEFGSYTLLMMVTVYSLGRMVNRFAVLDRIHVRWILISFVLSAILCGIGFGEYASPFAMMLSVSVFALARSSRLSESCKRVVLFCAPSMFSIFLLHSVCAGTVLVRMIEKNLGLDSLFSPARFFVVATIIFLGGLSIDLVRRFVVMIANKELVHVYERFDGAYNALAETRR